MGDDISEGTADTLRETGIRSKIYSVLEPGAHPTGISRAYEYFMIAIIVISLIPLIFKQSYPIFTVTEWLSFIIFVCDYILRWATADIKLKRSGASFALYPFTPMAIVDLLSIIPFIGVINPSFKLLRMLRLIRILRVFKLLRYSKSIYIIGNVFRKQHRELLAVGTLALAYILICALVVFNVEQESFNNFFDAVYWATISLTTVGYGDLYPKSEIGRAVAMVSSLMGVAVVALPAGIITAGYMQELEHFDEEEFREQARTESLNRNKTSYIDRKKTSSDDLEADD